MTSTDQAVNNDELREDELREQATKRLKGQQAFKVMLGIFAISLAVTFLNWALQGGGGEVTWGFLTADGHRVLHVRVLDSLISRPFTVQRT